MTCFFLKGPFRLGSAISASSIAAVLSFGVRSGNSAVLSLTPPSTGLRLLIFVSFFCFGSFGRTLFFFLVSMFFLPLAFPFSAGQH